MRPAAIGSIGAALVAWPFTVSASEICGHSADDPRAFLETMQSDPQFEATGGNDLYLAFMDRSGMTVWTFTTARHEAYPAVVCRYPQEKDGSIHLEMQGRCFGTKAACDRMMAEFEQLNRDMAEYIARQQADPRE